MGDKGGQAVGYVPPAQPVSVDPQFSTQRLYEMLAPTHMAQGTYNNAGTKLEPFTYTTGGGPGAAGMSGAAPWKLFGGNKGKTQVGYKSVPVADPSKPNVDPAVLPFAQYAAALLNPTYFKNYGR